MEYMPLTKKIKLENEQEIVTCSLFDTEQCPIHICGDCGKCKTFVAILKQLNQFEECIRGVEYQAN